MMKYILCLSLLSLVACNSAMTVAQKSEVPTNQDNGSQGVNEPAAFNLKAQADYYKQRYGLKDPYTKLVSNKGDGYESLYGVRNLRLVLHGIYYRGGANNLYNKYGTRDNSNPLPAIGLKNLCNEGFSDSVYFYSTNYSSSTKTANCVNLDRENSVLDYGQISILSSGNEKKLLQRVYEHIKGIRKGPMYAHCWNGWHASGYGAAISLQQFCGWTPAQAQAYWVKNTDGNSVGYESVENKVKNFKPMPEFKITAEEKAAICP